MKMSLQLSIILTLVLQICALKSVKPFVEIVDDVFKGSKNLMLAAFTDLDADKSTDLLYLSKDRGIEILYGSDEISSMSRSELLRLNDTSSLSSVVPADFDGDLRTDLLLIYKHSATHYNSRLCFGAKSTIHYEKCVDVTPVGTDEPLILDYDGDMRPDILIQTADGNLTLLTLHGRNITETVLTSGDTKVGKMISPHSSAFVDLNADLAADIVLTTEDGLVVILNKDGVFDFGTGACKIPWRTGDKTESLGMAAFIDINSDSFMDILTTVTEGDKTEFILIPGDKLHTWLDSQCQGDDLSWMTISVRLTDTQSVPWSLSVSDRWIRSADVDNDGYIDILVTLTNNKGETRPFIIQNTACNATEHTDRCFTVMWDWLDVQYNITQVAFYDIFHEGMMDVVINAQHDGYTQLHILQNNIAKQSCFLSVKVGSGLCGTDDDTCSTPYSNIVGPTVRYNSTHPDGSLANGVATQLTQSTNQALQIPYIQFGLGSTPNFIDVLTVGVARQKDQSRWSETWKTIVPNSHLVIVPRPPDKPEQWLMHLYVTPSHLVLITGAVILGLVGLIAIIIAILHLKEKHQDKQTKLQEAHRFHFNAM